MHDELDTSLVTRVIICLFVVEFWWPFCTGRPENVPVKRASDSACMQAMCRVRLVGHIWRPMNVSCERCTAPCAPRTYSSYTRTVSTDRCGRAPRPAGSLVPAARTIHPLRARLCTSAVARRHGRPLTPQSPRPWHMYRTTSFPQPRLSEHPSCAHPSGALVKKKLHSLIYNC
jgi:hypothetical protein